MFELIINGESKAFENPVYSLDELLQRLNISKKGRIFEVNGNIIKDKSEKVEIKHLDRIEIIQFMGGG